MVGRKAIAVVLLVFLGIQFLFILKDKPLMWDEATYIGMGKYVFSFGNVGIWEEIRPFGLPLVLGVLWKAGFGVVYSLRFLSLMFSAAVILVSYLVARQFMSRHMSAISAAFVGFSPVFFTGAFDVLTDIPSLFFAMLAVYFFLKDKPYLSGISAFLAFFFRFPHFLIIISIFLAYFVIERKEGFGKSIRFLSPVLLLTAVFLFVNSLLYGFSAFSQPFFLASSHQNNAVYAADGLLNNLFYYFIVALRENVLLLFFLPGIFFALKKKRMMVIILAVLVYLSYFTFIVNKQERFFIAFIPFFSILSAYWIECSLRFLSSRNKAISWSFIAVLLLIVVSVGTGTYFRLAGHYNWLLDKSPDMGVYGFFSGKNATVLTTDPVFSAYSDTAKFIHYYSNPDDSLKEYEANSGKADFVVYTPDYYPCDRFGPECEAKKRILFERVISENTLIINKTVEGRQFYIFSSNAIIAS